METRCDQFQVLSRKALRDAHLQQTLRNMSARFSQMRLSAFAQLENPEELKERAHKIKKHTLEHLDEYLELLEERIAQLGGRVHWAATAAEARGIIEEVAISNGVKTVVKGKSMVTEEIALNKGLSSRGIEVSETDLGEFIVQLAGEPPSHLVGPAIHKTKEQIADLFKERLGARLMEDPQEMTMFAREILRQRFLEADMGITGVNLAVAETGSIALFENEGNIRLTTTLPRIHVALMGIEKVIPGLDDLGVMMKLLSRSATGQKLPTYVSIINGPKREGESDGAEEFHLVILDNGRSRILADQDLRETLYCIRCGACLNHCPVYLKIGGHAYGWIYSGPVGSILTPQLIDRKRAYQLPYASTLCGACAEVCPVKINIPSVLRALRRRYVEDPEWERTASLSERGAVALCALTMRNRWIYKTASRLARNLPPPLNRLSTHCRLGALDRKTFREEWREQ